MANPAAKIGDVGGGNIITGSENVLINGVSSARIGDQISPHGDGEHQSAIIVTGSNTVFINGIPASKVGDSASCGDIISSGSLNVNIG